MSTLARTLTSKSVRASVPVENVEQHSIKTSLAMHLLPGVFIVTLFVITAPLAMQVGLPPLMAMIVGATVGLAFQLAHLVYQGKQRNGKWSLEGIVLYRGSMPIWQYLILVPSFAVVAFLIYGLAAPLGAFLLNQLTWLPEWFEVRSVAMLTQYPRWMLVVLFGANMLINGVAAPIIEEMYFRGYLMPRLTRFGRWTSIVETALFTLYHFWQPYLWVTVFFSMLPVVVAVAWKRNVKLGILTHATYNIIGGLLIFAQLLG